MANKINPAERDYNAVLTANVIARDQLTLITPSGRVSRGGAVHTVELNAYINLHNSSNADLKLIHHLEVSVPVKPGQDDRALIRRAVDTITPGLIHHTWWEWNHGGDIEGTLLEELSFWADLIPTAPSIGWSTVCGLGMVADPNLAYTLFYEASDDE